MESKSVERDRFRRRRRRRSSSSYHTLKSQRRQLQQQPADPPFPTTTPASSAMQVLLPGDPLPSYSSSSSTTLHLGPGLHLPPTTASNGKGKEREDARANKAGLLGFQEDGKSEKWWVEGEARRVSLACGSGWSSRRWDRSGDGEEGSARGTGTGVTEGRSSTLEFAGAARCGRATPSSGAGSFLPPLQPNSKAPNRVLVLRNAERAGAVVLSALRSLVAVLL